MVELTINIKQQGEGLAVDFTGFAGSAGNESTEIERLFTGLLSVRIQEAVDAVVVILKAKGAKTYTAEGESAQTLKDIVDRNYKKDSI